VAEGPLREISRLSRAFHIWHELCVLSTFRLKVDEILHMSRELWSQRADAAINLLVVTRNLASLHSIFLAWAREARERGLAGDIVVMQQQVLRQASLGRDRAVSVARRRAEWFHCCLLTWAFLHWHARALTWKHSAGAARVPPAVSPRPPRAAKPGPSKQERLEQLCANVFVAWRLTTLLERQALLRAVKPIVATTLWRAVEWRFDASFKLAGTRALAAWRAHLEQVICERRVQIAELERDELLRQVTLIQDERSRNNRNTLATIERSMSAALLARALEGDGLTFPELAPN